MVYINDHFKFIFIENPKSGSTSIIKAFEKTFDTQIARHARLSHLTSHEVKMYTLSNWDEYTVISTYRDPFKRWCSCMNFELHGKRNVVIDGKLEEVWDFDTLEKLKKHIHNPRNCIWCLPQEQFTEDCDIILNFETDIQQQWNDLHHLLKFPGEPVTIEHKNINKEKKFDTVNLKDLYQSIYV